MWSIYPPEPGSASVRRSSRGILTGLVLAGLLMAPWQAWSDTASRFAQLRDKADRFEGSLSAFLDRFVGECTDPLESSSCRQASAAFRQRVHGKLFYFIIGEDQVSNLSPGGFNPSTGEMTVNLTPFFPAGGYAITQGAPKHTDAAGNPVFPHIPIKVKLGEDMSPPRFARLISNHDIRMQLVFTPLDVWELPRRGGGKMAGVRAELNGVVLSQASTGDVLGAYYGGK